ncbi:MAG: AraC-like DNA-binding protein [Bermanella sp.]|jgi:AraC-like DNA-binding protein
MQQYAHNQPQVTLHFQPKHMALVDEIKQILKTSLSDHPNFDMIASAFNISGRTLRRQLAEAGTSFQKLLDNQRRQYAINCLQNTQMSTEDIAEALGFSDVANFRHAFKKWVGLSPAVYRQQFQSTMDTMSA